MEAGRGKWVKNLKYHAGANQPKQLWLPASTSLTAAGLLLLGKHRVRGFGIGFQVSGSLPATGHSRAHVCVESGLFSEQCVLQPGQRGRDGSRSAVAGVLS